MSASQIAAEVAPEGGRYWWLLARASGRRGVALPSSVGEQTDTSYADLGVSTLYIVLTSLLASVARKLVHKFINEPFVRALFLEGIASAELCGTCFELIIVADNFGISTYAVYLFCLTIWWSQNWGDATACPYTHLEDVVQGKASLRVAALKIWAELTGGILIYRYVQLLWSLELVETHEGRAFGECSTDLQIPVPFGALVEGIATCLCRVASKALSDLEPRFGTAIDSFIGTALVVAAFNYSGGYFNPVLATSLKYGCHGNTIIEHIVVYWIGACCGAIASVFVYELPVVQNLVFPDRIKRD